MSFPDEPQATPSLPVQLPAGTLVDRRYEILSFLGSGGMCEVYKAKHLEMDRVVALKILHRRLVVDSDAIKRFQREALAASALNHPNIVKVFGFGHCQGVPYIAMEHLDGRTLADLLKERPRLSAAEAMPLFEQILDGLQCAHEHQVVHRDLKPSNIMVLRDTNQVKILDFGIAKILPEGSADLQKLTQTGELFGTVNYMSPEQCLGKPLDQRSDLYSMGCLMYETLDGRVPFAADTAYATMINQVSSQVNTSQFIPTQLAPVIAKALAKDAADRPQSAFELKQLLSNPSSVSMTRRSASRGKVRMQPQIAHKLSIVVVVACLLAIGAFGPLRDALTSRQVASDSSAIRPEPEIADERLRNERESEDAVKAGDQFRKQQKTEKAIASYEHAADIFVKLERCGKAYDQLFKATELIANTGDVERQIKELQKVLEVARLKVIEDTKDTPKNRANDYHRVVETCLKLASLCNSTGHLQAEKRYRELADQARIEELRLKRTSSAGP